MPELLTLFDEKLQIVECQGRRYIGWLLDYAHTATLFLVEWDECYFDELPCLPFTMCWYDQS